MKKILFLIVAIVLAVSCNDDESSNSNRTVTGQWSLAEILSDPGDGSGTFQPVVSTKTITFYSNGEVSSNGSLCTMGQTTTASNGTYSETDHSITVSCDGATLALPYTISDNRLIVSYFCIEGCKEKYVQMMAD